jgi:para-nitrobenzyl esterase
METVAPTALGALSGVRERDVVQFRGVPYAQPPVGPLRFAPPQPASAWSVVHDATRHGPIAPQGPSRLAAAMGACSRPMDEDCLTLTITTPHADKGRRPVLVWLHGGAWITGAGSLAWYDGATLAGEGDIVVVGVNYRLGALGWLRHPRLGAADVGMLDEIAALRWVRDHIAAFGGDPDAVTVMGHSAGATNIGRLLADPEARGLFRRAILLSGSFGRAPLTVAAAEAIGGDYIRLLDLDPDAPDIVARLRALPVAQLLAAQGALLRAHARFGDSTPPFMPTVAAPMTEAGLRRVIAEGARGKDVLIGATHDDAHAFIAADPAMVDPDPAGVAERFAAFGGAMDAYRQRRPGGSLADLLGDLLGDHTFIWPSLRLAEAMAAEGAAVHAYQFDWAPPASRFRACHCIDLPFVFGDFAAWQDAPMLAGGDPGEMATLSAFIRRAWIGFIHTGTPSPGALSWPRYEAARRLTMQLGPICGVAGDPAGLSWRAPAE